MKVVVAWAFALCGVCVVGLMLVVVGVCVSRKAVQDSGDGDTCPGLLLLWESGFGA